MIRRGVVFAVLAFVSVVMLTLSVLLALGQIGGPTAATSTIRHSDTDFISTAQAEAIALTRICGDGTIVKTEDELDENPPAYEVVITCDGLRYEIKIHAVTGAVIAYEKDDED